MVSRHVYFIFASVLLLAMSGAARPADTNCLMDAIKDADDDTTVGELRALCVATPTADSDELDDRPLPIYERIALERTADDRPFLITAHQPNYIKWTSSDSPNVAPFQVLDPVPEIDDSEMVYQVSIKAPVWRNVFGTNTDAYIAYTAKSWWQLFNDDFSAPFRETNYQPEFFFRNFTQRQFLGIDVLGWDLGINHQSNGRADPLSRSWNRVMARVGLQLTDDLALAARAWYRIPEDDEDDDNPQEYKYLGYGDLRAIWTPNRHTVTAMLLPGTEETSYELTWSYPISSIFRVYASYYKGHGESLLDYDYDNERFGIGFALNDFLARY